MAIKKMSKASEYSRELPIMKEEVDCSQNFHGVDLKKSLVSANQFLSSQLERNKKYIKSLKSFLAWVLSCSGHINPELTSLMLSNTAPEENYDFELRLISSFNRFICKSKYFSFIVELAPLGLRAMPTNERIALEVKLYSSDTIPKSGEFCFQ